MAIGRVGSFATDRPVQDGIGDALKYNDQMGFNYRAEAEKKKELKKREEDAKLKEYAEWDGKFNPTIIGNSSIDDPLIEFAMSGKQRASDITRELYTTTDFNKRASLMSERNSLLQGYTVAQQTPEIIKAKVKSLEEGIEKGKYNSRDVSFIQRISKNIESGKFELNYTDRGVASIKIFDVDEDNKPIGILKETSLGDLVNSFEPKLSFNYEAYKDAALKNVKPDEYGSQRGSNILEGTRISSGNVTQSKTYADVILNDPNKLYEAEFLFNEKDTEKLRAILEKDFITSIATKKVQKTDTSYLNYGLSKKAAEKDEVKTTVSNFDNVTKDNFTGKFVDGKQFYKRGLSFSKPLKISNLGGSLSGLNGVEVYGFTQDKESGSIVFRGKALKTKNSKFKVGGKMLDYSTTFSVSQGNSPQAQEAQAALDSYSTPNNYGSFTRTLKSEDEANMILQQVGLNYNSAIDKVYELNKEAVDEYRKGKTQEPKKPIQFDSEGNMIE
jgi:hypothetical protein